MKNELHTVWVFAHGWAETAHDWLPLLGSLQRPPAVLNAKHTVLVLDAYAQAGSPRLLEFKDQTLQPLHGNAEIHEVSASLQIHSPCQWIGVGHSLGFAKLLTEPLPWTKLISLHGFTRFTAHEASSAHATHLANATNTKQPMQSTGTAPRVLQRMIKQFQGNPDAVLHQFRQRSGYPAKRSLTQLKAADLNTDALLADLRTLLTVDESAQLLTRLEQGLALLWVDSPLDEIVPAGLSADNFGPQASSDSGLAASTIQHARLEVAHAGPMVEPDLYTGVLREFCAPAARSA